MAEADKGASSRVKALAEGLPSLQPWLQTRARSKQKQGNHIACIKNLPMQPGSGLLGVLVIRIWWLLLATATLAYNSFGSLLLVLGEI